MDDDERIEQAAPPIAKPPAGGGRLHAPQQHSTDMPDAMFSERRAGSPTERPQTDAALESWWSLVVGRGRRALTWFNEISASGMAAAQRSMQRVLLARKRDGPVRVSVSLREDEGSRRDPVGAAAEGRSVGVPSPNDVNPIVGRHPAPGLADEDGMDAVP